MTTHCPSEKYYVSQCIYDRPANDILSRYVYCTLSGAREGLARFAKKKLIGKHKILFDVNWSFINDIIKIVTIVKNKLKNLKMHPILQKGGVA